MAHVAGRFFRRSQAACPKKSVLCCLAATVTHVSERLSAVQTEIDHEINGVNQGFTPLAGIEQFSEYGRDLTRLLRISPRPFQADVHSAGICHQFDAENQWQFFDCRSPAQLYHEVRERVINRLSGCSVLRPFMLPMFSQLPHPTDLRSRHRESAGGQSWLAPQHENNLK